MFRVYDTEMCEWVKDDVYLNPDGELFLIKRSIFGRAKTPIELSQDRYIYHNNIELSDKNDNVVYVGDYIKAQIKEDEFVVGLVCYAHDMSAYIILCENNFFYTLGSEVCSLIEVIGNVFDGYEIEIEEDEIDGERTLQESEG